MTRRGDDGRDGIRHVRSHMAPQKSVQGVLTMAVYGNSRLQRGIVSSRVDEALWYRRVEASLHHSNVAWAHDEMSHK